MTTQAPPAFNWDELVPAVDAPAPRYVAGAQTNVRESIHKAIRQRAEESLAQSVKAIVDAKSKGTKEENVPPQWMLQPTPTADAADQFVKDIRKYALHRPGADAITAENPLEFYAVGCPVGQVTARAAAVVITGGENGEPVKTVSVTQEHRDAPAGTHRFGVRYAVKPLEKRNPAKTSAGNGDAKSK